MMDLPAATLAFAVALGAAPIVLWALRRAQLLDVPTLRSSHQIATPRSGGIAPAVACIVAAGVSSQLAETGRDAILVVSVCLGAIGLADDLHPRSAVQRLIGQVAVALLSLVWFARSIGGGAMVKTAVGAGIVVWLVGYVNAFNFMDGINGLAVAQVFVAGASWWIIGSHEHAGALAAAGLIPAAAIVAFAPFNVPKARMFLGDVGSYFLGGWLAVAVVVGLHAGIAPEAVVAPLTVFLADAGVTFVQRVRRHEPWSQPHRDHSYQRLVAAGWSHLRTTLTVGLVMATVTALGALSLTGMTSLRVLGDCAVLIVLAAYLMLPDWLSNTPVSGSGATANS